MKNTPGNPVVPHITFMNRDPKVVWEPEGKNWVMAIFLENDRYMLLYSKDLLHWEDRQVILHPRGSGVSGPVLSCLWTRTRTQWKWVLWGSTDNYIVGRFEGRQFCAGNRLPFPGRFTPFILLTASCRSPEDTLRRLSPGFPRIG